jgi:hypothetical protein
LRGRVREEEEEGRCWEEEVGVLELSATDEACCWSSAKEEDIIYSNKIHYM